MHQALVIYDLLNVSFNLRILNITSLEIQTSIGIIQGSPLSPILFTYLVDKLLANLPGYNRRVLYADDLACPISGDIGNLLDKLKTYHHPRFLLMCQILLNFQKMHFKKAKTLHVRELFFKITPSPP